jgi:hypothetical protein
MVNFAERSVAYAETRRKRRIGLLWTGILCVLLIVVFGVVAYLANADATKSQEDALTAKDEAAIAIKSSREAKDEAAIAIDEAAIAKDEAAIANADAKKAKKKTSALTLSSEAFELTLYAKYDAAKQRADKAVALYNEIEEDFETDILYKTYYSILSNTDLTGDALIFEDVKIIPALDTTYTHCSYESDPDFDLDVVKNVIDEYKMAFSLTYTIDKKYGALGLKSGEIKIFNAAEFTVIDTIFVGTYRVTSMAYNSNGTKLVASTVDDKFTIIPLSSSSGQRNKKKHLIRKESPFRIEEILFENDNTIKTIGGEIVDDGTKSNMSKKYPATVKKLKEILN